MTFLTLLIVLTQTISIGVVDEPLALANGTKLMPGDRVLAIHDSTHPWLTFLPSGEFRYVDSSKIIVAGDWHPSNFDPDRRPDADSGAWSEPDRQSTRAPWRSPDRRIYFSPDRAPSFSYRDSSFWGRLLPGEADGWFPLTHQQVQSSISGTDSSGVRTMLDMADAMRRGRRTPNTYVPPDSVQRRKALRLYELTLEISRRHGYREITANVLLTLVSTDLERRDTAMALARLNRAAKELVGVKSKFGRADAFATWQMMELARGQKQTARMNSLARRIIVTYPDEAGSYASRSVWFDVEAADRLLQAAAGDESQAVAAARFLLKSKSIAVRYRGYERLIHIRLQHSDQPGALVLARTAMSLPHSSKWLVHAWSGDLYWPPENHDFKNEFMDSLDALLPRGELDTLYLSILRARDTTANWYTLSWYLRLITQGKFPPRPELLKYTGLARNPSELKQILLCSIDSGPTLLVTRQCSTQIASAAAESKLRGKRVAGPDLSVGDTLMFLVLDDGRLRFGTTKGNTGSARVDDIPSVPPLSQLPAIAPQYVELYPKQDVGSYWDIVYNLRFAFDGRTLRPRTPGDRSYKSIVAVAGTHAVNFSFVSDTSCLGDFEPSTVVHPGDRAWKDCFLDEFKRLDDTWPKPSNVSNWRGQDLASYWSDSFVVVFAYRRMALLSLNTGKEVWQRSIDRNDEHERNALFLRDGFATFEGDSLTCRDYQGQQRWSVPAPKDWRLPWPMPDTEIRRPTAPRLVGERIPVFTDSTIRLLSAADGQSRSSMRVYGPKRTVLYEGDYLYISDSLGSRILRTDGTPLVTLRLPYLTFPLWDKGNIVAFYSRQLHLLLNSATAERLSRLAGQN
jgi:hypothetical protein